MSHLMERATRRAGFALPAAMLAMVIIGALVTGGLYAAMIEDRSSTNVEYSHFAFLAAERGLQDVLGTKTRPWFENNVGPVGATATIGPVTVDLGGVQAQYTVYVRRLATRLFKVDSEGEVLSGGKYAGSKRRLSQMMRIAYTFVPKDRAVTTQGALRTRGQSGIVGQDLVPPLWSDCTDMGLQKAVVAKNLADVDVKGAVGLVGNPEKAEDPSMDATSFEEYGDMHLDELKQMANFVYPDGTTLSSIGPVASGGECVKDAAGNWGDPLNPLGACHTYWPVIYAPGDLHLSGGAGRGQGILIVEGSLVISGGFEFNGIVFVYGGLTAAGTGNKFIGSVNILGTDPLGSEVGENSKGVGDTQIHLSSCAIERAHLYNDRFARPIPLGERKFVDMSGLGM